MDSQVFSTPKRTTEENFTSTPVDDKNVSRWATALLIGEVASVTLLVVASWLLISMVVYGTKTKRWKKKPGASSLNSGAIYTFCTIVVLVTVPRLAVTEYIYILPRLDNMMGRCELICDVDVMLYSSTMYVAYAFMWLLQRKIYTHPYVKPKIGTAINWFSRLFGVLLACVAIGLTLTYVLHNSYNGEKYGCVLDIPQNQSFMGGLGKNIIVAGSLVVTQGTILILSVYPVMLVKFDFGNGVNDSLEDSVFDEAPDTRIKPDKMRRLIKSCFRRGKKIAKSPIEAAARRAMIGGIIMVLTDVLALTIAFIALPAEVPVALRQTCYDIASVVNLLCAVSSLGLASNILMLFCPNCTEVIKRRSRTNNVFEYEMNDDANNRSNGPVGNRVGPRHDPHHFFP